MNRISASLWLWLFWLMVAVIVVSNVAVTRAVFPAPEHPLHGYFNYGQLSFPLAFLISDLVNRLLGAGPARRLAALAFLVAVPASVFASRFIGVEIWILALRIGLASGLAFLFGQLLDIAIFQRLRALSWWLAPLISSLLAGLLDTWLFYSIAFAGSGDWWLVQAWIDYGVKVLVALAALLPFRIVVVQRLGRV